MDIVALNNVVLYDNYSCEVLIDSNLAFADRIYEEAIKLDEYGEANRLSDDLDLVHRKYDLLRTFLWINANRVREQCPKEFSIVVYLYEQQEEDLAQSATQNVWSKVLFDLKQKRGRDIVLIPLAADANLTSLDSMVARYNILRYPVVIINDKVIYELKSVEELEAYLDN
jgi:hypothetical protein